MSPAVFRSGPYRFYFLSRVETRMHIHADSSKGEARFSIEPGIELARSHGLPERELTRLRKLVEEHEDVIRHAWIKHFGG
jgi:hypothetical protein